MSRGQALLLQIANFMVCSTGLVYAWMSYLVDPVDEWAVVNHPWQPHVQHLHVLVAPLLVFALGLIWSAHIVGKMKNGRDNRSAGITLTALFLPMAASGYLLQVAVEPGWRLTWVWIHVVSSLLWVLSFVVHQTVAVLKKNGSSVERNGGSPVVTPFRITSPPADHGSEPGGLGGRRSR